MDLKTTMALRNYGINPALSKKPQTASQSSFAESGFSLPTGQSSMGGVTPKKDFASVLKNIAFESIDSLKTAEQTAQDGLTGKADIQSVVEAMTQAEVTVKTATAIRDKVVEAYQEILRMPI